MEGRLRDEAAVAVHVALSARRGDPRHCIRSVSPTYSPTHALMHYTHFSALALREYVSCLLDARGYDDVLGIGHTGGFSSAVIPGAGEPNFDFFEAHAYLHFCLCVSSFLFLCLCVNAHLLTSRAGDAIRDEEADARGGGARGTGEDTRRHDLHRSRLRGTRRPHAQGGDRRGETLPLTGCFRLYLTLFVGEEERNGSQCSAGTEGEGEA